MLRVYLDQNKWIDMARAATGHPQGARFVDVLAAARAAAAGGSASFPLDIYRYMETGKRRDERSRRELAAVMSELSQQHTIALPHLVLPSEIDQALKRRFGRPEHPREYPVFGAGMSHMTAGQVTVPSFDRTRLPNGMTFDSRELTKLERIYDALLGRELLGMGDGKIRAAGCKPTQSDLDQRYVDFENTIGNDIRAQGLSRTLLDVAVRASDLGDIQTEVVKALQRIDVAWEDFIAHMAVDELMGFIDDLPTRYVTNVMRGAKLRQVEQKWEMNDFTDVLALPVPAVYCDVLVTEKQWVHRLRQGKVDQRYNTLLLTDTAELVDVLNVATTDIETPTLT